MPEPGSATADRRSEILSVAGRLFSERPYDAVTTSEIARQAEVGYGLIAHHFGNKRGLYLAAIESAAEDLASVRDAPPPGGTPLERLRNGIDRHIAYMTRDAGSQISLANAGLGTDPEARAIVDRTRWAGAQTLLSGIGVRDPGSPVLRAAIHSWTASLDELVSDTLEHRDVPRPQLVDLAVAMLVAVLRAAMAADDRIEIDPTVMRSLTGTARD